MVEEHLCTVAVDVAMGEEHAVSHVQLQPPPPGADSLKTCQRDDKDLYSSESFVRILSYVKGLSEHVSGSAEYSVSLSQ